MNEGNGTPAAPRGLAAGDDETAETIQRRCNEVGQSRRELPALLEIHPFASVDSHDEVRARG